MKKLKQFLFGIFENIVSIFANLGVNRRTFGAGKTYDFFYRFFWPYNKVVEIQGSKMLTDKKYASPAMLKTFEAYAENLVHEESTTELFKKVVKEDNVVVDLGANIGYFTLLAARLVGKKGKVYAFEPEPKNYDYLIKNIKLNDYENIVALQKAVSDKKGKTKLFICPYDTGHHTINQHEGIEAYKQGRVIDDKKDFIEIETITLDEFFEGEEESIDFIKIDVEGAEMLVLSGMDRMLRKNKRLKMIVEFFPLLIKEMGSSPIDFIRRILEDYHFSIFVIPDDYNALKGEMIEIDSAEKIMSLCKGEKDHINLFVETKC